MIAYSDLSRLSTSQVHTGPARMASCATTVRCSSGELASVVYSDKCVGTNHTLPTMGAGRWFGGLWVGAYVKIATHQWLDERGVRAVACRSPPERQRNPRRPSPRPARLTGCRKRAGPATGPFHLISSASSHAALSFSTVKPGALAAGLAVLA